MATKHFHINLSEENYHFLRQLRREMIIEDAVNMPLAEMLEYVLIDARKKNDNQKMKEMLIRYKRLGRKALKALLSNL